MATVILGAQWGDEGKGKLTDVLCESVQLCCRAAGGHNAGHTIVRDGVTYDVHILRECLRKGLMTNTSTNNIAQSQLREF